MENILSKKEFQFKKILNSISIDNNFKEVDLSKYINIRDIFFLYKYPREGWEYIFVFDSKLKEYPIIYISNKDFTEINFIDYLGEHKINGLHIRYSRFDGIEGSIKFIEKFIDIKNFIKSLPNEDVLEDWFIEIIDMGYKITSVDYGFLESNNSSDEDIYYNVYNVPSGTENKISILLIFNKEYEKNNEFDEIFNDCLNRSKFYLKNKFNILEGIYKSTTNGGLLQIEIRFRWSFS